MKTKFQHLVLSGLIVGFACVSPQIMAQGKYVSGDFHQHTTYSDGSYTFGYMMEKNNQYGLDWWANSEHGGGFNRWGNVSGADLGTEVLWEEAGIAILGKPNADKMWRWQSIRDWSFRDTKLYRQVYPNKTLIQGVEWNAPGHEHVSVAIINNQFLANPNCNPVAEFEYKFDNGDTDDTSPNGWTKATNTSKAKTIEAITWMQANYPTSSWIIPAHPERANSFKIEDFRNMNNAGPSVCFGFESQPGHQKDPNRGGLRTTSYGATGTVVGVDGATWGGTGAFAGKIGGVWDALLSEGRKWWLFASSDSHYADADFFPGEYQKTKTLVSDVKNAQAIADGLRSGNSYVVMGDLIDSLNFTIGAATMGQTHIITSGNKATISIIVRDPQSNNYNTYSAFTNPELDHIDLIAGKIGSKVDPISPNYTVGTVATTAVIARFGKTAHTDSKGIVTQVWTDLGNGVKQISFEVTVSDSMYFRLRGTHHAFGAMGTQIDAEGNPLLDTFGSNTAAKAFEDLWFYSNPIFVKNTATTAFKSARINTITVSPNPSNSIITINGIDQVDKIELYSINGILLATVLNEKEMNISSFDSGIYILNIKADNKTFVEQVIIKK